MIPLNNPVNLILHKKISKRTSPHLRRSLWMAAFMSLQCNPALYDYYSNLQARGKNHFCATTAVDRKLCIIVRAIIKSKQSYSPHVSYERLCNLFRRPYLNDHFLHQFYSRFLLDIFSSLSAFSLDFQ